MTDPAAPTVEVTVNVTPPNGDAAAVAAHQAAQSHRYVLHFPEHPARTADPHYVDFNHYHTLHRKTARCYVGERIGFGECKDAQGNPAPVVDGQPQAGLELHHAHVEFSLQQGISLAALEVDFPGISNTTDVGAWVETDVNFRWLCVTPDTPVLMADGSLTPIQDVRPGQFVIGKDGGVYPVTAVGRRPYRGTIVWLTPTLGLTENHRVLTGEGWLPAGKVAQQLGMLGTNVIRVRGVESEVLRPVVGSIAVDVVDALSGRQLPANQLLHDEPVLHDQSFAIPHTHVSLGRDPGRAVANVPLRQRVEARDAALVGAEVAGSRLPVRTGPEVAAAVPTGDHRSLRWLAVDKSVRTLHTGWVHDISVAHSHSFIAGGIVVHNCAWHHRGAAGAHTAAHSDWEAQNYVLGLISK